MPQLKLGLVSTNFSFYDPNTNTYITPGMPPQIVNYDDTTDLSNIANAVLAQYPSLYLFEGKLPQAVVDAYKAKFTHMSHQVRDRADAVNAAVAETVNGTSNIANGPVKENTGDYLLQTNNADDKMNNDYIKSDLYVESIDEEVVEKPKKPRGSKNSAEK